MEIFDENLEKRVIVQLVDPPSSNGKKRQIAKSGLVRISNFKRLRHEDKKLRRDFTLWMPPSCQVNKVTRMESVEFYDVVSCIQYIKSCDDKHIILILSRSHAENKRVVSEFKQFPQIALTYCRVSEVLFNKWLESWSFENQFFTPKLLSSSAIRTRVHDLDEASQLLLMQLFFTELILKLPRENEAKEDFLTFCRLTFKDDLYKLRKVEEFNEKYHEDAAINWYTKSDSFIFRIVSKACASFNFDTFFKIRFFLRDLYMQLQKLHAEQLTTLLQTDLVVYRGTKMSSEELSRLRNKGELFVTRNFVSTTTEEDVACIFSGENRRSDDEISVLISMHIDREEVTEKPIAFIHEHSQIPYENEVMLPMGIVFRTVSYEEVNSHSTYSVKIKMVRGKEEQEIEKELNRFHLLVATSPFLGMTIFLKSIQNGQYCGEYCKLMSHALKSTDPELAGQLTNMLIPNNAEKPTANALLNMSADLVSHVVHPNMEIQSKQCSQSLIEKFKLTLHSKTNATVQAIGEDIGNTDHIAYTAKLAAIVQQPLARWIAIFVGVLIVVTAVVTPISIIFVSRKNTTATVCSRVNCSTIIAVQNPSPNYQAEHLNLTCSQSLSNLTIIQIVRRTHNETHAQQYQTFSNYSTNMTYIVTSTEIIYTWYLLPGMHIVKESFPYSIQVQFYYTTRSVRDTRNDTWQVWLQSVCGHSLNFSGSF